MLVELKVKDFAIIDHVQMEFGPGLNIISGETGAGKSIIVRSLGLLMGAKSQADDVRTGVDQSIVEGHFDLSDREDLLKSLVEHGLSSDADLIVRRVISRDGKNRVYLNGHLCSLTDLKNIVAPLVELTGRSIPLIEVTGQHDNKHLLSPHYHLDLLDQYCKSWDLRQKVAAFIGKIRDIDEQIASIRNSSMDRSQRLDFIKYQIAEIEALDLDEEKDSAIEERIKALKSKHSIAHFYQQTRDLLEGDSSAVTVVLDKVIKNATALKYKPDSINKVVELLEIAQKNLVEASFQLNASEDEDGGETQLEELESRLSDIRRLEKKFGPTIGDIIVAYTNMREELSGLENSEEQIAQWELEKKAIQTELAPVLKTLTAKRKKGALKLAEKVNEELADLNMKGVIFSIQIEELEEPTLSGQDQTLFTIQNGAKGEARPLHKSASGGELSRILLSLKVSIGEIDLPRSYLFDEVDTGVSGPTAQKVGFKLKEIAQGQQVICITHLPQVASFADQHYFISKKSSKGQMAMTAVALEGKEQIEEIARLISGEKVTATSLAHAKQLLADAR
jgi:DNA repair protein RecN (Recombination protein N)